MSEGVDLTRRQRTQLSSVDSSLVCGSEWSAMSTRLSVPPWSLCRREGPSRETSVPTTYD